MTSATVLTAEAVRFTADLKQNKWMASQWQTLLDNSKAAVGDNTGDAATTILRPLFEKMDNFIVDQGYDTTTLTILDYLKSDLYQTYLGLVSLGDKPSDSDARRFVQTLLTNSDIASAWQALVGQVAKGQATADDLNAFMKGKGFACSYMQVNAAFQEMRDHNIIYWSGSYRTQLTDKDGTRPGPIVVISSPSPHSSVGELYIGTILLPWDPRPNGTFYANGVYTWRPQSPGVPYSGSLTFSAITQPCKVAFAQFSANPNAASDPNTSPPRHVFTAELAYVDAFGKPNGETGVLTGWLDVISDNDPSLNVKAGAGAKNSKFPAWVNYLLNGLMVVQMLHSFVGKKKNLKDDLGAEDEAYANKAEGLGDAVEGDAAAAEGVSPFASEGALEGSSLINSLKAESAGFGGGSEVEAALKDAISDEASFNAARDGAASAEGEGWGSDLADLGELL